MATIRKRSAKYEVQVRRKGFPAVTKSFHKLSDAREWARLVEIQADRQELRPDRKVLASITLEDLISRYRETVLPNNKSGHVEAIMLNAFLRHPICKKTLAELSPSDFSAWKDERLAPRQHGKTITPKSVKRLLSPLQHMFEVSMAEWGIPLPRNPLANFKLKVTDNRRERRLKGAEFDRLLEATGKTKNTCILPIILFALETAMRRGEILAMKWDHVDLQRRSVVIHEAKNGDSRKVPLTSKAVSILVKVDQSTDMVFPTTATALRQSWVRLTKRAALSDLRFHDLRHEAISRFFELGLTVPEVASISGHRDIRMLMRYAHADNRRILSKID